MNCCAETTQQMREKIQAKNLSGKERKRRIKNTCINTWNIFVKKVKEPSNPMLVHRNCRESRKIFAITLRLPGVWQVGLLFPEPHRFNQSFTCNCCKRALSTLQNHGWLRIWLKQSVSWEGCARVFRLSRGEPDMKKTTKDLEINWLKNSCVRNSLEKRQFWTCGVGVLGLWLQKET